jgi:hypothetical protein
MRRTWLRGSDNVAKRYWIRIAAYKPRPDERALVGAGTPRAAADINLLGLRVGDLLLLVLLVARARPRFAIATVMPDDPQLSTGC